MKQGTYRRYGIQPGIVIIGVYLLTALLAAAVEHTDGEAVHAMEYMNKNAFTYVRTLGFNTIETEAYSEAERAYAAPDMVMHEQNYDALLEKTVKLYVPLKAVGGTKIQMREPVRLKDRDVDILCRIVEAEAGGEDTAGQMLVANVVLNRMKRDKFPDSVKGVVFANDGHTYQFSPISDGRYYSVSVSKGTKNAVKRALAGEDNSNGAEYFMCRETADSHNVRWFDTKLRFLFKHGCHEFFTSNY